MSKNAHLLLKTAAIVIFLSISFTIAKGQDSILLHLNLTKGETFEFVTSFKDTVKITIPSIAFFIGKEFVETDQSTFGSSLVVTGIDSSNDYIITSEYNQTNISEKLPGINELEFDSKNMIYKDEIGASKLSVADRVMRGELNAKLYHPFKIVISSLGRVISISGIDKIRQGMIDSINNVSDARVSQKRYYTQAISNLNNEQVREV